jgi:hypothetical protein
LSSSESDQHSSRKRAPLRHSLRTSLICALITALLSMFLISGGRAAAEALITALIFAALGGAATFWILRTGKGMLLFGGFFVGTSVYLLLLLPLGYLGRWQNVRLIALMTAMLSGAFFFLMGITRFIAL